MGELQVIIKRIEQADVPQCYCCMTEVPTPWPDALCQCRNWIADNLGRYAEGFHAQMQEKVVGHLYYAASDRALFPYVAEPGATVLYCEWVQRRHQGQGIGRRLYEAFVAELKAQHCKGILVEATDLEGQMNLRHYTSRGFQVMSESGHRKLLYLALDQPAVAVRALQPTIKPRRGAPVEVLVLSGYLCPLDVAAQSMLLDVAAEFGAQVVVKQETLTPGTLERYGVANGIFINGKHKLTGPTTEEAMRQAIMEEM
jgi:GNAT superfamily N-acetyltransferase